MSNWGFGMYSIPTVGPSNQSAKRKFKKRMAAETIWIEGKFKWAKVYKPDTQFEPGAYKIDIYPSEDDLKALKALGLRKKVKEDEDGKFVQFARKLGKKPWADEEWGPPVVVDGSGNKFEKLIGNGSEGVLEVVVYDAGKFGKGSRLERVIVKKHVVYEKPAETENSEAEEKPKTGLTKKPAGLPF